MKEREQSDARSFTRSIGRNLFSLSLQLEGMNEKQFYLLVNIYTVRDKA